MRVQLLDTPELLVEWAEPWNEIASGHPLRGYEWYSGWWRHYGQNDASQSLLVLAILDDANRLVGLAPWRVEQSVRRGRVIRWLGDGEVCTDHSTLLVEDSQAAAVGEAVADYLLEKCEDWDLLQLDDADADDIRLSNLMDPLEQHGCQVSSAEAGACWAIELPADWEEFLALQSKSHRKQLRRAERRVLDSESCIWHPVRSVDELNYAWPILIDLHQRRRQSLGEPGCFASDRFESFHRQLSQRLLERGQLRMSWLEIDHQPVAAELHFAGAGQVFAYQGGVDPDRLDDEPGRLSNIATIRAAIEEGTHVFDFLRGDEAYKAHWRAQPRPTVHLKAVSPKRSAVLRASADRWVGAVRDGLRGLRSTAEK